MKTPWINYKEIKQIDLKRQTTFFFKLAPEPSKSTSTVSGNGSSVETDSDIPIGVREGSINEIYNLPSNSNENDIQDLHNKTDEPIKMDVLKVVKKNRGNLAHHIRTSPMDYLAEDYYFKKITNISDLTQTKPIRHSCEMGENSQAKSILNLGFISKLEQTSNYNESANANNTPELFDVSDSVEPNKVGDNLTVFGLSQLLNSLKNIHTSPVNIPCELSNDNNLLGFNETNKENHGNDTQIELDKVNNHLKDEDKPMDTNLEEKGSESKQVVISQLVNTLKRVQAIQIAAPPELSVGNNLFVNNEGTEKNHVIDIQTECETKTKTEKHNHFDNNTERFNEQHAEKCKATDELESFPCSGEVFFKTIKSLFSTFVEIDDFLKEPVIGSFEQNTFEFPDQTDSKINQLDTKFVSTTEYYQEQVSCHLVGSSIHEVIELSEAPHDIEKKRYGENRSESIMTSMHIPRKKGESNYANNIHDYIKIRVPVVVGEYNIELCIVEEVLFEKEVMNIKEISNKIVLTNCQFTPTRFSKTEGDGTRAASGGILSIEGLIAQSIEYSVIPNKYRDFKKDIKSSTLYEKITLELLMQLVQEQKIWVNFNDIKNATNDSSKNFEQ